LSSDDWTGETGLAVEIVQTSGAVGIVQTCGASPQATADPLPCGGQGPTLFAVDPVRGPDPAPTVGSLRVSGAGTADGCRFTVGSVKIIGGWDSGRTGTDCAGWIAEPELCSFGEAYSGCVLVFCAERALPQAPQKRACGGQVVLHCKQKT